MKNINWKVRLSNPVFIVQILMSVFLPVLGYFGLTAADITTWSKLGGVLLDAISNPYVVGIMIVGAWNAINDPTVKGLKDSQLTLNKK